MATESFQAGDRVQLKSGGPVMTIDSEDDGKWWCVWFDQKGEQKGGTFGSHMLIKMRNRGDE
jgi:uncharacterized protein YodC (DUF2158 family)